ncbi:MAG: hypothetical protein ACYDB7_01645, partial [Mycobacteriales bacterium]
MPVARPPGVAELAASTLDRLALAPAEQLHGAVAARAFRAVGPLGFPTRALHDRIAAGVYQSIRRGLVALAPMARALGAPPGTGE